MDKHAAASKQLERTQRDNLMLVQEKADLQKALASYISRYAKLVASQSCPVCAEQAKKDNERIRERLNQDEQNIYDRAKKYRDKNNPVYLASHE